MIRFRFGPEDVANVRFAISPLMELHNSVRALDHPEAKALHLPWVAATRERVADLDIGMLRALQRARAYTPDFINPPPGSPLGDLKRRSSPRCSRRRRSGSGPRCCGCTRPSRCRPS